LGGPGGPETLAKGGGRSPPPYGRVSGTPGAAQTPKRPSPTLNILRFPSPKHSLVDDASRLETAVLGEVYGPLLPQIPWEELGAKPNLFRWDVRQENTDPKTFRKPGRLSESYIDKNKYL
jgi:hypothetical protein